MHLECLDSLGYALAKTNDVEANRMLLEHVDFEQMLQRERIARLNLSRAYW